MAEPLDLEPIKARLAKASDVLWPHENRAEIIRSWEDVPALLAEIERLKAPLRQIGAHGYSGGDVAVTLSKIARDALGKVDPSGSERTINTTAFAVYASSLASAQIDSVPMASPPVANPSDEVSPAP